jgi:hypothetical protein
MKLVLVCIDRVGGVFIKILRKYSILAVLLKIKQYFVYINNTFLK